MMRTLIAGFGNPLRGDDGFGVEVIRRLEESPLREQARLIDVGTGGIHLAHELLAGYDRVVIVDAMRRGDAPGTVTVHEISEVEAEPRIDLHLVLPARALGVAKVLGALPPSVLLVGCEPRSVDELTWELSAEVRAGVDRAIEVITGLVNGRVSTEAQDA